MLFRSRLQSKILKRNKKGEYAVWYGLFGRGGDGQVTTIEHVEAD